MSSLKQTAQDYVPRQIKSIADLPEVSVDCEVKENFEAEFPYKFIEFNDDEYKVPDSVLRDLKMMLADNVNLKRFKVKKDGAGLKTRYTVIPLV